MDGDSFLRIRSYNVGIGNCFLVSLKSESSFFHMLLDCGSMDYCDSKKYMEKVINDINKETESDGLDVLVLTHPTMIDDT